MATATRREPLLPAEQVERLDDVVARSRAAGEAFRRIDDQEAVDRIVWALVVAGLQHAVELARLAMEETGLGVFEDNVVKNYIATDFLHDYLKDKRSVGVIDEDAERAIQYVAEPIGVVLALTAITNPTSTVLFKAIVAAKTRTGMIFRPSARAAGSAVRAVEVLQEAGERAGMAPGTLHVIPDPTLDVSQYLFHHPGVDFIWTTGGPKAVAAANAAGKPCLSVGAGNAPVYIHRSADEPMAVVDMVISKTFDSSLICPAEQSCIVDDAVWDETVSELQRMGARLLSDDETAALAAASFGDDGAPHKYAQMAWVHGLAGHTPEERRERLFERVVELLAAVGMPASLSEMGIARVDFEAALAARVDFEAALPDLADAAFADPRLRTNPRMPLLSELVELLEAGWHGRS